ncbi:hypothetical protein K438DRAFT_1774100 [Mycena galopus ATCC 62051]|nr:hypothetical protein K438DRAFT_1774100 [Mycena galopus ATCC 62051]
MPATINPLPKDPSRQAAHEAEIQDLVVFLQERSDGVSEIAASWMNEIDGAPPEHDSNALGVDHDQATSEAALNRLDNPEFSTWSLEIRIRVIMDIWHAMARVKVSKEHGLRRLFGIALRDAIFIPDEQDKAQIEAYLKTQNSSWDHQLRFNSRWLWHRCRRTVPPPDKLYETVNEVFKLYGPQKDSKTNLPLFNPQAWHDAKNVLKAIKLGLLSDPPGVQLYYQMYIEKKTNLPIFRCVRGTCIPEGAIHKHLRDQMPKSGTSVRHASARIKDYVFIHNLIVGTLNRSGKINLYVPGNETVGILALPEHTKDIAGILSYNLLTDSKFKHAYLAEQQGTKYAGIAIHSVEEKMQFTQMMQEFPGFNVPNSPPNFKDGARTWNSKANGETIFYKLESHLKSYHLKWLRSANEKSSVSQILPKAKVLEKKLRSENRGSEAYTVAAIPVPIDHPNFTGILPSNEPELHLEGGTTELSPPQVLPTFRAYQLPPTLQAAHVKESAAQSLVLPASWDNYQQPGLVSSSTEVNSFVEFAQSLDERNYHMDEDLRQESSFTITSARSTASSSSRKREAEALPNTPFASEPPRQQQKRTCHKCKQQHCKGSNRRELCKKSLCGLQ